MNDKPRKRSPKRPRRTLDVTFHRPNTQPALLLRVLQLLGTLLKTLAWPTFAFVLFFYLREPMLNIAKRIPDMLAKSSKVSIGTLSFELREQAQAIGAPQFADLIQGLSPAAIEQLLRIGRSSSMLVGSGENESEYFLPSERAMAALLELDEKGLLHWEIPRKEFEAMVEHIPHEKGRDLDWDMTPLVPKRPITSEEQRKLKSQSYRLSEKGLKALDLIIASVANQLKAAPKAVDDSR